MRRCITIVPSRDPQRSAEFLTSLLDVGAPHPVSHFIAMKLANGVTLDYAAAAEVRPLHYAFLLGSDREFDAVLARVTAARITYYADPDHNQSGVVNHRNGGRGFYFDDPDGHNMEVFTKPPL